MRVLNIGQTLNRLKPMLEAYNKDKPLKEQVRVPEKAFLVQYLVVLQEKLRFGFDLDKVRLNKTYTTINVDFKSIETMMMGSDGTSERCIKALIKAEVLERFGERQYMVQVGIQKHLLVFYEDKESK